MWIMRGPCQHGAAQLILPVFLVLARKAVRAGFALADTPHNMETKVAWHKVADGIVYHVPIVRVQLRFELEQDVATP